MTTHATPANMRKFEEGNKDVRALALDLATGETFAASSGDYFMLADDEPLVSSTDHAPLVLVIEQRIPTYKDALTGRDLDY